jgi:hypothetical protein
MKKGYVFVVLFALFIAVAQTWFYRAYTAKDLSEAPLAKLVLQGTILFSLFVIPGVLLVRWYYKQKGKTQ